MSPEAAVRTWVLDFVVGLGLCPFAAAPLREGRVAYVTFLGRKPEDAFYFAGSQVQELLDTAGEVTETSLLVFPETLGDFEEFLDFVEEFEGFLADSGADALVQLAHFHPGYRFAGVPAGDPANATNRAPYPVVQLLRVSTVAKAVARYPDAGRIPERNAALLRKRATKE